MTAFNELMARIGRADADAAFGVTVSADWLQGRTVYGGLSAALCLQSALNATPELPPLRSAQLGFVGPANGALTLRAQTLRQGKSAVFVGVDCFAEAERDHENLATRALFCFGAPRVSGLDHLDLAPPDVKPAAASRPFFGDAPPLAFMQHFEFIAAGGNLPFSRNGAPSMALWIRHRDPETRSLRGARAMVALLALADAPPPAAIVLFEKFLPISTMTWHVDVLTDEIATDDGWWLIRTFAERVANGYSAQSMTVWNAAGRPVMAARQTLAIYG